MSFLGGAGFTTLLTDLGGAAQTGLGIYNETQGGPAVNTTIGSSSVTPGSVAPASTLFGFSTTEVIIGVILLVAIGVGIYFVAK